MNAVVGVFAHPDDEAFGPSGTLAQFARDGRDVYVICVTKGDAGQNLSDKTNELSDIREEELEASIKILGIKKAYFLDFKDGTLSNNLYHEVADKLQELLKELQPEIVITLEPRGVSGHLDHIAVTMITTYVFKKLSFIKELWYFSFTDEARKINERYLQNYFIYLPPGYKNSDITKKVDVSSVWDQKIEAMKQHESQISDVVAHLKTFEELPKEENYIILKKDME